MEKFPTSGFEKKKLEKDGRDEMSRREFLGWMGAASAAFATSGIPRAAEASKKESKKQVGSLEKIEQGLESVDPKELTEIKEWVAFQEWKEMKEKDETVEKIRENKKKGVRIKRKISLEEWGGVEVSGKARVLEEVWRVYGGEGGRIEKAAKEWEVTPEIVAGIITKESNGNPKAVAKNDGKKFAFGLMQITLDKVRKMKKGDTLFIKDLPKEEREKFLEILFHPYKNILCGSKHFKELIDEYSLNDALSAYNLGRRGLRNRKDSGKKSKDHHYTQKVKYLAWLAKQKKEEK